MKKRWVVKDFSPEIADHLQGVLKVHPVLCQLLSQRSISTYDEAKDFFRPKWEHLHDPFLMKDMDKAIDRIQEAMQRKEKFWCMAIMMWTEQLPLLWFILFSVAII